MPRGLSYPERRNGHTPRWTEGHDWNQEGPRRVRLCAVRGVWYEVDLRPESAAKGGQHAAFDISVAFVMQPLIPELSFSATVLLLLACSPCLDVLFA